MILGHTLQSYQTLNNKCLPIPIKFINIFVCMTNFFISSPFLSILSNLMSYLSGFGISSYWLYNELNFHDCRCKQSLFVLSRYSWFFSACDFIWGLIDLVALFSICIPVFINSSHLVFMFSHDMRFYLQPFCNRMGFGSLNITFDILLLSCQLAFFYTFSIYSW